PSRLRAARPAITPRLHSHSGAANQASARATTITAITVSTTDMRSLLRFVSGPSVRPRAAALLDPGQVPCAPRKAFKQLFESWEDITPRVQEDISKRIDRSRARTCLVSEPMEMDRKSTRLNSS